MSPKSKIAILVLFPVLLILACEEPAGVARVIQVIDGDTIAIDGGYHVRYIGIDAPEKGEFCYLESERANKELVEGKRVRLEKGISEKDRYGRLLRYVYVDDTFVNVEMVRQGYACAKAYPPDVKYQVYLEAVEKEARQTKRGIWRQK
jgi:micrococcal nuclease